MSILIGEGVIPVRAKDETAADVARIKRNLDNLRATAKLDAEDEKLRRKVATCERELERLGKMKPSPEVDARTAAAEAKMRNLKAQGEQLDRMRISVRAEANTAGAQSNLRGLGRESNSANSQIKVLVRSANGIGSAFTSAAKGPVILMAIASAAGIAGGAIAAIPAALASLGGIGGVLGGSLSGVGEALKGYKADQDAASAAGVRSANSAASSGRAIRDAGQAINDARRNQTQVARDSARQIEDAERSQARVAADVARSISDAKADQARIARDGAEAVEAAADRVSDALGREKVAQESLNDAFESAADRLQDLRDQQNGYALDAESASIRVAREEAQLQAVLADSNSTTLDIREARNQLAQAKERETEVTRRATKSAQELAEAERAGLNGSDEVVAARKRLQDAQDGTRDAQEALARITRDVSEANVAAARRVSDAVRDGAQAEQDAARQTQRVREQAAQASEDAAMAVSQALQGLADAQAQQAEGAATAALATSKYADAMAKLTPEGQAFVRQLISMKPLVDGLSRTSQRSFLPGLTDMLRDSEGLFPIFNGFLDDTGTVMGNTSRKAGELFRGDDFKRNLQATLDSSLPITQAIGDGMVEITDKTIAFGAQMAPASQGFADFIGSTVSGYTGMLDELEPYAEDFKVLWQNTGRVLEVVLPVIGRTAGEISRVLGPTLGWLADVLDENSDSLDEWIFGLGGAYIALKTLSGAGGIAGSIGNIAGLFSRSGNEAAGAGGKLRGFGSALTAIPFGPYGLAIAGGTAAMAAFVAVSASGKPTLDQMRDAVEQGGPALAQMRAELESSRTGWENSTSSIGRWIDSSNNWIAKNIEGRATLGQLDTALAEHQRQVSDAKFKQDQLNLSYADADQKYRTWQEAIGRFGADSAQAIVAGNNYKFSVDALKTAQQQAGQATDGHTQALRNQANQFLSSIDADIAWKNAIDQATQSVATNGRTTDLNTQAGRNNMTQLQALSRAAFDDVLAKAAQGASTEEITRLTDNHRKQLYNTAIQMGMSEQEAREYVDRLNLTPAAVTTNIKTPGMTDAIANARTLRDTLAGILQDGGRTQLTNAVSGASAAVDRITKRASGGPLRGPGTGTSDSIPLWGSNGEWVIRERVSREQGDAKMDLLNSGFGEIVPKGGDGSVLALASGGPIRYPTTRRVGIQANKGGNRGVNEPRVVRPGVGGTAVLDFTGMAARLKQIKNDAFPPMPAYNGGAGVEQWRGMVRQALAIMGQPITYDGITLRRMAQESGGNPNIVNRWDSNWRKGTPSVGLMQVIGPTYRSNRHPRYDVGPYVYGTSVNPLANTLASMRYALGRYGSLPKAYNKSGGYRLGGRIPGTEREDRIPILAQSGERVLTRAQNDAFERLVALLEGSTGLAGGRGPGDTIVNIQQVPTNAPETARLVALGLRGGSR